MANKLITLDRLTEFKDKCDGLYATQDVATSEKAGLVKIGYEENGKNYPVELSEGKMFVNVPWTDTNTTYSAATTSAAGLMSAADKTKLEGIATGANKYTHPSYTAKSSGLYKVTVDSSGHVSAATAVTKADITALGIPGTDTNTTYESKAAASGGTAVSLVTTGEKYTWNNKAEASLVNNIVGGTVTVGDANKLGGKAASAYQTKEAILDTTAQTIEGAINELNQVAADIIDGTQVVGKADYADGAAYADEAASAENAAKLGGKAASEYALKSEALKIGTTSTTAAAGNHTHLASLAADTGTSAITLAHGGKYKLTTGGSSVIFTMPADNNTTYSTATSSTAGLVKIGYTASGKNYPVALNDSGQMYVNVPWTDTNTTYLAASSSAPGLMSASDYSKLANMGYATADDITALFN